MQITGQPFRSCTEQCAIECADYQCRRKDAASKAEAQTQSREQELRQHDYRKVQDAEGIAGHRLTEYLLADSHNFRDLQRHQS